MSSQDVKTMSSQRPGDVLPTNFCTSRNGNFAAWAGTGPHTNLLYHLHTIPCTILYQEDWGVTPMIISVIKKLTLSQCCHNVILFSGLSHHDNDLVKYRTDIR